MDNLNVNDNIKASNAKDFAYKVIKENILNLNFLPGMQMGENDLSEALNVSRTPIRDAISILSNEKLVEVYPQKGTYVSKIAMQRVKEAVFIRTTMENAAVEMACDSFSDKDFYILDSNLNQQELAIGNNALSDFNKLDNQMHEYFFKGNHFQYTWQLLHNFSADYYRIRYIKLKLKLRLKETINEHKEIIQAIKNRDAVSACQQLEKHIKYVYSDVEVINKKYSDYFA